MERQRSRTTSLLVTGDQPLIGVVVQDDGPEVVHYFVDEASADAASPVDVTRQALGVIGAWSDLDWGELESALDTFRRQSVPTPPIDR